MPPHLFSQLNQHREGLDFLRTSGQLSKLFTVPYLSTEQKKSFADNLMIPHIHTAGGYKWIH